jgi:hypothetical protein
MKLSFADFLAFALTATAIFETAQGNRVLKASKKKSGKKVKKHGEKGKKHGDATAFCAQRAVSHCAIV